MTKRQQAMYTLDEKATIRRPSQNTYVKALYDGFLGDPLSHTVRT